MFFKNPYSDRPCDDARSCYHPFVDVHCNYWNLSIRWSVVVVDVDDDDVVVVVGGGGDDKVSSENDRSHPVRSSGDPFWRYLNKLVRFFAFILNAQSFYSRFFFLIFYFSFFEAFENLIGTT